MDDAHVCADRVREACRIRIPNDEPVYNALKTLFAADLEQQGAGSSYADISTGKRDALLPVPYWAWITRESYRGVTGRSKRVTRKSHCAGKISAKHK